VSDGLAIGWTMRQPLGSLCVCTRVLLRVCLVACTWLRALVLVDVHVFRCTLTGGGGRARGKEEGLRMIVEIAPKTGRGTRERPIRS